ncbi:MAG: aminoacetone oxidase family FAD-binding enzyme [Armatimonadetes bacterium]|nr:aminoacetone oxidase family FAD-binding enzyme [Armatimonadota bacterium]
MSRHVLVVGGGAAGTLAALRAAEVGAKVTLLEKNDRLGIKILISGGGKCNITHAGTVNEVLKGFRHDEARFLRRSMYRFDNHAIMSILEGRGLELMVREDGRVFPVEGSAKDVVEILRQLLVEAGVEIRYESPVAEILFENEEVQGARLQSGEEIRADATVVAVGGSSYPKTGATGDGYPWMKAVGHTVKRIMPALAPIYLQEAPTWAEERSGVALRGVLLKAKASKELARWRGDLLFTHHGVSGPTVLGVSREVAESLPGDVKLTVDLLPDVSYEDMKDRFVKATQAHPKRTARSLVEGVVPSRLEVCVVEDAAVDPATPLSTLTAKDRNRLIETLKGWEVGRVRAVPLERGEVVAGGVALDEVDSITMASTKAANLFLCGEILDIAGAVGGYNLQAAFSTGYVAGESAGTGSC